ncbi:MAG: hypothetical protein KDC92_06205 [Bacteroidetes bacterium]|nr:hypothetical protein [Bacteroidota bacterium]
MVSLEANNMIKSQILTTFFLLVLVFAMSCDREPSEPTWYLEQETKDYCFFKKGSWWVYEEATSGAIDSVFCYKDEIYIAEPDKITAAFVEYLAVQINSSFYNKNLSFHSQSCLLTDGKQADLIFFREVNTALSTVLYYEVPNIDGEPCQLSSPRTIHLHDYDNYLGYDKVRAFETQNPLNLSFMPIQTIWARDIGIIKRIMPDGKEWILKKYFVIQ